MGVEIERKFLVHGDAWRIDPPNRLKQGYLCRDKYRNVRVRIDDDRAFLTVKGLTQGASRLEFEYPISVPDAERMLNDLCLRPLIEKYRYSLLHAGKHWTVDEFLGDNQGLVVAEIELDSEQESLTLPAWVGLEVTHDPRYYNSNLSQRPFSTWRTQPRPPRRVIYLEMREPHGSRAQLPKNVCVELMRDPTVEAYRELYNGVGSDHQWTERNDLPNETLLRIIRDPALTIYVLRVAGNGAGYCELKANLPADIEIVKFGLLPAYRGQGFGKLFLAWTLDHLWSLSPQRVWLHTCEFDHPAALPNYLKAGFRIYDQRMEN